MDRQNNTIASGGGEAASLPEASSPPHVELDFPPVIVTADTAAVLPQQMACMSGGSSRTITPSSPPPHYEPQMMTDDLPPPKADFNAPPPYEIAAKLPTYEEVQREKIRLGEPQPDELNSGQRPPNQPLAFLAIDSESTHDPESETGLLGTDFMFFTAFLVAFLFNWIGFLLLMCFCHTIAARYGALSGFGLSLAKWTLIVKHSTDLASRENSWLWWLIMGFGLLIFIRAIIQYVNIKREWRRLSGSAQERLLFFY